MEKICIIGAGAWGTALALTAHRAGGQVTLLARDAEQAERLLQNRENQAYLPGAPLPSDLMITSDWAALQNADTVLQVTPASSLRDICSRAQGFLSPQVPWVICAKGIVRDTGRNGARLLSEVTREVLANPIVILSGPSFADEVGRNLPTAITLASEDSQAAHLVARSLRHPRFRCYVSEDPIGVQVAGAVKNVLAIGCGIVHGKGFGNNAVAALITRGLVEMRRLGLALGGKGDTFFGLAGVGDVTLTCSSEQSRNRRLGKLLGQSAEPAAQILAASPWVTEGVPTVEAVHNLSQALKVPMPLCQAVYAVLYENVPIDQAIEEILSRPSEAEFS